MYILKTDSSTTVTEYLQLRDENFALSEYFKLSIFPKMAKNIIEKYNLQYTEQQLIKTVQDAPYNKLVKI